MPICKYCFRFFEIHHGWHLLFSPLLCRSCYEKIEWHHRIESWRGIQVESLIDYGPNFEKMIFQFKANFDIELGSVFLNQHAWYLRLKYWQYKLVLAPTHDQDIKMRGFHPLIEMFHPIGLPMFTLFEKTQPYRQSEQHGPNRYKIKDFVQLKQHSFIPKRICLIDDVMTTGETLHRMIDLLKPFPITRLKIFVLARKKQEINEITSPIKNDKIRNWK